MAILELTTGKFGWSATSNREQQKILIIRTHHSETQSSQNMCLQRSRIGACIFSWQIAHISPAAETYINDKLSSTIDHTLEITKRQTSFTDTKKTFTYYRPLIRFYPSLFSSMFFFSPNQHSFIHKRQMLPIFPKYTNMLSMTINNTSPSPTQGICNK